MAAQLFPTAWHQKTTLLYHLGTGLLFKSRLDAPLTSESLTNYLGKARKCQEHTSKRRSSQNLKKLSRSSDRQPLCRLRRILTSEPGNFSASALTVIGFYNDLNQHFWWTDWWWYPLVICYIAIENGHRISEFSQ
jgi:hypothetical protein